MPGHQSDPADLFAAWLEAEERGGNSPFQDLVDAHPEHAEALRGMYSDWQHFAPILERVVPGSIADVEQAARVEPSATDDHASAPSPDLIQRLGIQLPEAGRYRFRAILGRGGGGVVLRVWDTKLQRPLAMKVVLGRGEARPSGDTPPVDAAVLTRFVDEARIASQLDHPGIVPVHELGADSSGRAFFTMRLVKGEDLSKVFERALGGDPEWTLTRLIEVLVRVCEAVGYAHSKGVLHRDLKPANVMLGRHGEVHVMDWGLARMLAVPTAGRPAGEGMTSGVLSVRAAEREASPNSPLLTSLGSAVGTPAYMAPEQARGELDRVDARTDVYAIGAMLYELIAGEPPYVPQGVQLRAEQVLMRVIEGAPAPLAEKSRRAPPELVAICQQAMAREPERRYQSVDGLQHDLRDFTEGRVVRAYESGMWAETRKWMRRNRGLAASIVALIVALSAGLVLSFVLKRSADASRVLARAESYAASVGAAQTAYRYGEFESARRYLERAPDEHRNWEWRYLDAARDTSILRFDAHDAAFSPDGTQLVVAASDGGVRVVDASSGTEIRRIEGTLTRRVSFSPDGSMILGVCWEKAEHTWTARAWEVSTGSEVMRLDSEDLQLMRINSLGTFVLTLSFEGYRDGQLVHDLEDATMLREVVRVWDRASLQSFRLGGEAGSVGSPSFSPDGLRILGIADLLSIENGPGGVACVWDARSGQELLRLEDEELVGFASFNADGTLIATCGDKAPVRVRDAMTGEETLRLEIRRVQLVHFSPDGKRLITTDAFDNAHPRRLWDAHTGAEIARLEGDPPSISSPHFSRDGKRVVAPAEQNTARVWDAESGGLLARLVGSEERIDYVQFNADGTRVLAIGDARVRVWDVGTLGIESGIVWSFSHDGARIVTGSDDCNAYVRDADTGHVLLCLAGHADKVVSAKFSSDDSRIVTVSSDGSARTWDGVCGTPLARLRTDSDRITGAEFHPDGTEVATTSAGGTVQLWDTASGREHLRLHDDVEGFKKARFSPDGMILLTTSRDQVWSNDGTRAPETASARLWDTTSGTEIARLEHESSISAADFSPDGSLIVTQSDRVRVWDIGTHTELWSVEGRGWHSAGVQFSSDGARFIATVMEPPHASIWDSRSGAELVTFRGHTGEVTSAWLSPDGTRVVTASRDETVRIWDANSGAELVRFDLPGEAFSTGVSPDGTRIVASSVIPGGNWTYHLWDSVPNRVRFAERQRVESSRPVAIAWLDTIRHGGAEWGRVAESFMRDTTLSPDARVAAREEIARRANGFVAEASRIELKLRSRLFLLAPVVAELERDPTLPEGLRQEALRLARLRIDLPEPIERRVFDVVRGPDASAETYERALLAAQVALELAPEEGDVIATYGAALYRAGRMTDARDALVRVNKLPTQRHVAVVAFLAMAHARLGETREAWTTFRVGGLSDRQRDDDLLLEEAETVLAWAQRE